MRVVCMAREGNLDPSFHHLETIHGDHVCNHILQKVDVFTYISDIHFTFLVDELHQLP